MDLLTLAGWAGAITTIFGLIALVLKPFYKIDKNLSKITLTLDTIDKSIQSSQSDRNAIHGELKNHDDRLDLHEQRLVQHGEQIKTLFKNQGGKK